MLLCSLDLKIQRIKEFKNDNKSKPVMFITCWTYWTKTIKRKKMDANQMQNNA